MASRCGEHQIARERGAGAQIIARIGHYHDGAHGIALRRREFDE